MSTPIITTTGTSNGLMKIIDQDGVIYRLPLPSISEIADTSNTDVYRLDISHSRGSIVLLYLSAEEITTALATIDALY